MTHPIEDFIPRNTDPEVKKILDSLAAAIDELVNFGSNILAWDVEIPGRTDEDLPTILFLRNFIEQIDAISVLVKNSIGDPCNNLLRTAFENFLSAEYLFEDKHQFYNRSMSFLTWNIIVHRKWLFKGDGVSAEYKDLLAKYKKDKSLSKSAPTIFPYAITEIANTDKIFALPKYAPIKAEYDRTLALKKNPHWYSLFGGPDNLEKLAGSLKHYALYEILYRTWSSSTHGTNIIQGKLSIDVSGLVQIAQIRDIRNIQSITQHCHNLSIMLFQVYIKNRLPGKQSEFDNWYAEVRKVNLALSSKRIFNVVD